MEEIIKKAREWAISEIEKHGSPDLILFDSSYNKAVELADKLGVDTDIVSLGAILMDIKLGEAKAEGKIREHVGRSIIATKEFLKPFNLPEEKISKIIECVEQHHGADRFKSLEAEICANADCYRFVLLKNWIYYLHILATEKESFAESVKQAEFKFNEKRNALSLEACKKELESDIELIERILEKVSGSVTI